MSTASPAQRLREMGAAALIGVDRSGGGAGATAALLDQAATLGTRARAGFRPRKIEGQVKACPADASAPASPAAMATLTRLLGESDGGLLEEWAELAQAKGVRVGDASVPVLMDWWSRQPRRSEVVFAVLGKRGEWLASLNAAWRKPVASAEIPTNAEEVWQTGTAAERVALLTTVRRHDPARALAMVQSTWQSDGADERKRFVGALAERLAMADEPFLEASLDDKSKVVRREAAEVLCQLAGSRLRARMGERAREIIGVDAKRGILKRGSKITLTPPNEFDKAWERDGIEEQAAGKIGKRAWWMRQILAATDLPLWTELSGLEPGAVLGALEGDDYLDDALGAMAHAARVAKDPAWSGAIVGSLLKREKAEMNAFGSLWRSLPRPESEQLQLEIVGHKRFSASDRWMLLASIDRGWSAGFSASAMKLLRQHRPGKAEEAWHLYESVDAVSRLVCVDAAEEFVETVVSMFPDEPSKTFKQSIDRARLRAEMHKEFAT